MKKKPAMPGGGGVNLADVKPAAPMAGGPPAMPGGPPPMMGGAPPVAPMAPAPKPVPGKKAKPAKAPKRRGATKPKQKLGKMAPKKVK